MARRYYRRRNDSGGFGLLFIGGLWLYVMIAQHRIASGTVHKIIGGLIVVLVLIVARVVWRATQKRRKVRALQLANVDTMNGFEFERYVARLLKNKGYTGIKLTERYDLGVDIIAVKGGVTWGIQVKRYSGNVKALAVRQVVTALNSYKCQRAMVVSNSFYSQPAQKLAASNNCVLVDRDELAGWITDFQQSFDHFAESQLLSNPIFITSPF